MEAIPSFKKCVPSDYIKSSFFEHLQLIKKKLIVSSWWNMWSRIMLSVISRAWIFENKISSDLNQSF